ncbi:TPA: NupC/NupG family nucleoside CNT transporter [Streptococcus agalactiae]|jgi:Nucleoside permease|uniref:Na+ dependent nucleoside transporter n=3 Tax=Streptococcus agalactiae TaxID=1311 RepID=Q8DWY9_STRA5|nr:MULTISPECIES: NupC/NupG family nucleoside CNT transporter [Streptococcus]EAO62382.1 Na+ dependent nucleoside transporter [Streptococcus agalactiae 18RS21]EPT71334.1 nucleoside transporter [Streptococcus agalactiae CCUG 38383]HEO8209460.1 NupC/NupG family nucleoside CNT transporter [Streptococcus agalactiae ADL-350]AAN00930.1 Na+ dependent nucleoside transporter [Streptococcus agalactiae 2603V/R]AIF89495.1 Na+ dependent nucleoside transporter domain-containing protein [Streptococcus agalacti
MQFIYSIIGILLVLGIVYAISFNRKSVSLSLIGKALIVQFIIALILVRIPLGQQVVSVVSTGVTKVINCGQAGLNFVFGSLADSGAKTGFIFAIQTLGNIVFLSALVSLLYYVGILGFVVKWIGKGVGKIMKSSEVESFVAVANMFLGQTDSPILVSKYLGRMTDSEIMVVLVSGMGSMSVSILGGYIALGIPMEYLLIASTMVPIGSILIAKILLPQTEPVQKIDDIKMDNKGNNANVIDAIAEGASTGAQMAFSIGASLIAFVGLVSLINMMLSGLGIRLEQIFSYVFAPFGFLMGFDHKNILLEGNLLGSKLILNEFVSFQQLGDLIKSLDYRTALVATISLCGFANLSSLGICVSGIAVLCPEKRGTLARLVFRAMIGGIAVSMLSAFIVGIVTLF